MPNYSREVEGSIESPVFKHGRAKVTTARIEAIKQTHKRFKAPVTVSQGVARATLRDKWASMSAVERAAKRAER